MAAKVAGRTGGHKKAALFRGKKSAAVVPKNRREA